MKTFFLHRDAASVSVMVRDGAQPSRPLQNTLAEVSPTFEWGYGGSGPEALAFSIVTELFGDNAGEHFWSEWLKWDIIAKVPRDGAAIHESTVRELLASYKAQTDPLAIHKVDI